jgi:hypothetical protein
MSESKKVEQKNKPDVKLNLMLKDLMGKKKFHSMQKKEKKLARIEKEKEKNEGYYDH